MSQIASPGIGAYYVLKIQFENENYSVKFSKSNCDVWIPVALSNSSARSFFAVYFPAKSTPEKVSNYFVVWVSGMSANSWTKTGS